MKDLWPQMLDCIREAICDMRYDMDGIYHAPDQALTERHEALLKRRLLGLINRATLTTLRSSELQAYKVLCAICSEQPNKQIEVPLIALHGVKGGDTVVATEDYATRTVIFRLVRGEEPAPHVWPEAKEPKPLASPGPQKLLTA